VQSVAARRGCLGARQKGNITAALGQDVLRGQTTTRYVVDANKIGREIGEMSHYLNEGRGRTRQFVEHWPVLFRERSEDEPVALVVV